VNGLEIPSYPILGAIRKSYQNVSGPLIDCSNFLLVNDDVCSGAEGKVCIVDYSVLGESEVGKLNWQLSNVAEENGCVALVTFGAYGWYDFDDLAIPFLIVVNESDWWYSLKSKHDSMAQVEVQLFGSTCVVAYFDCNSKLPCGESEYCDYADVVLDDKFTEGICAACPTFNNGEPDPAGCFFDRK